MESFSEILYLCIHWLPLFVVFVLGSKYILGVTRAIKSPLSRIPGPWYAPLTTLHLSYAFAKGTIWKDVENAHGKYGPIFRLGPRQVWISDMEAMKAILMAIDLPKVAMYAEISRDRNAPGLFGEMQFLFSTCISDLIRRYVGLLSSPSPESGPVVTDIMEDVHNIALDIMGECSFGKGFGQTNPSDSFEFDLEMDEKVWKSIPTAIFKGIIRRYQLIYIKRFLRRLGFQFEFDWPREMISVRTSPQYYANMKIIVPEKIRPDLLQDLIDEGMNPDSGVKMGTREVIDQMVEILLAVLGPNDLIISSQKVRLGPEFEYLEACIKEALRLHPIASEMGRQTGPLSIELVGYHLPPFTVVSASYRELHRNPKHWPEPLRSWPERWLQNRPEGVPAPNMQAYYPFSAGKHACIGKNFAMAEIRMVTANILSRFDFDEVSGQRVDFRQYITMQFEHGSWKAFLKPRYKSETNDMLFTSPRGL
ncbi:cytochrome P450 [Penicillium longicatenatum]|uniref:cytochrome P450 n=1 Tax=Penicillium longicatenatum TaxID=1561947 RepID=UPI0025495832|nr:cytochrome P450 [Penicillium longicatenatum]KAJ5649356.1 cytochrome P450 [Penicillium longicatenatum]